MEQKFAELQAKIEADSSLAEKLLALETPEEVQAALKGEGLDFSVEEINVLRDALVKAMAKGDGELSDEDLEDVAGGSITVAAVVAVVGCIAGVVGTAGGIVDNIVRSRW